MPVDFTTVGLSLRRSLPGFFILAGEERCKRRFADLRRELEASPFRGKIAGDYHWLELELGDQMHPDWPEAQQSQPTFSADTLAALYFAHTVVHVHQRLTPIGRSALEGRIRDALKSETGFSSLYLEMDIARSLFEYGYEVEFSDMEGRARYDFRFWKGAVEGEVECKSVSTDAGRKIHRKEFYRFMEVLGPTIAERVGAGADEVIVVTLEDRMPADDTRQKALRAATTSILLDPTVKDLEGSFFSLTRDPYLLGLGSALWAASPERFYDSCRQKYGDNCHVSGALGAGNGCCVVVRSRREDDHSAPQLEALQKAASQFSATRPAFIAIQYDDIKLQDLVRTDLRRRAGLLSYGGLFLKKRTSHVCATYFSIYGGLVTSDQGAATPAFVVPNPQSTFWIRRDDYAIFLGHIPDVEFAQLVGAPAPTESISYIPLDAPRGGPSAQESDGGSRK